MSLLRRSLFIALPGLAQTSRDRYAPPAGTRVLRDVRWPGLQHPSEDGTFTAGPSGPPWINSNAWLVQWHRFTSPGVPVWLAPRKPDRALRTQDYLLVLCDAEAAGAHWVIECDDASWPRLEAALRFFEAHRDWRGFVAPVHVGLMGGRPEMREVMNLLARAPLPYRLVTAPEPGMEALVLFGPPDASARAFAQRGGAVYCLGWALPGKAPAQTPFVEMPEGRGRIHAWTGPAAAAHRFVRDLQARLAADHAVLRARNAHASIVRYTVSADGRRGLVQLINFTGHRQEELTTLWVRQPAVRAVLHQIGVEPQALETASQSGGTEISIPERDVYAAVEIFSS